MMQMTTSSMMGTLGCFAQEDSRFTLTHLHFPFLDQGRVFIRPLVHVRGSLCLRTSTFLCRIELYSMWYWASGVELLALWANKRKYSFGGKRLYCIEWEMIEIIWSGKRLLEIIKVKWQTWRIVMEGCDHQGSWHLGNNRCSRQWSRPELEAAVFVSALNTSYLVESSHSFWLSVLPSVKRRSEVVLTLRTGSKVLHLFHHISTQHQQNRDLLGQHLPLHGYSWHLAAFLILV